MRRIRLGNSQPVRLKPEELDLLEAFAAATGLSKGDIVRRCVAYALPKFVDEGMNIVTFEKK